MIDSMHGVAAWGGVLLAAGAIWAAAAGGGAAAAPGCRAATPAPARLVGATALGPSAPAPYELGAPSGAFAGRRPRGVVIVVHGGAWVSTGPAQIALLRPEADRWRARGWATANVTYRPCDRSLGDVVRFYDLVRAAAGPGTPVCLTGRSAGGHLSLVVAARRAGVACAVSAAGPVDPDGDGPTWLARIWRGAFGARPLSAASPVAQARHIRARVLLATAADDRLVPVSQQRSLVRALRRAGAGRRVRALELRRGRVRWVHAGIDAAELARLDRAEAALVAPLAGAAAQVPRHVRGWW